MHGHLQSKASDREHCDGRAFSCHYSSVAFRGSDTATRTFSFFVHISIILEFQTMIKDSYNTGMSPGSGLHIKILMATRTPRSTYSMLAHKDGGHAHSRPNAHARHEDSPVRLPSNVQACRDLPCAGCPEENQRHPASTGRRTHSCQEDDQWRSHRR
jgi:hypothetical protein